VISYNRLRFFIIASLLFFSYQSYAQNSFSGTVTDDQGNPIPGVAVLIKGTTQGATTDFDGNYTIDAEADQTLVFQSIGFAPQEILLSDESTINITLLEDTELLDEIIVTGYTTQTRKSITGSIAVVDVGDLESLPEQSALGRLQGLVTGVQIGKNGGPGGTPLVRIRGISNNVSTSTDPLYVIDGVQTADSNVFNLINPSDIESIQVLKDASAAAIYGTRANNGVIIVTTKTGKGTGDGVRFNLNLSTTIQNARSEAFPEFLSPKQYADWIWTRTKNAGNTPNHPLYGSGASPVLPKYLTGSGGAESVDLETYALVAGGDNNPIRLANQTGTC
jgi:TonB-dependent SusC/RagA subfamily outer membrane receptor